MVRYLSGGPGPTPHRGRSSPAPGPATGPATGPYGGAVTGVPVRSRSRTTGRPRIGTGPGGPGRPGAPVPRSTALPQGTGPGGPGRPGAPIPWPARDELSAAQQRQAAIRQFDAALRKAGVNVVPYHGGPWSIFTHGGGDVVAKVWAEELLRTIGAPVSPGNVQFVYQWEKSEGGGGKYNPLNQGPTPGRPELTTTGSQYGGGAADYASWQAGIQGAADWLSMSNYTGVRDALRANNPAQAKTALIASPWAQSHYGYGSRWNTSTVPGGSIPSLPPLLSSAAGGTGGGPGPTPSPAPGAAPRPPGGGGGGSGSGGGAGGGAGASGVSGRAGGASSPTAAASPSGGSGSGGSLTGVFTELPGTGGVETLLGGASTIGDVGNALATISNTFGTVIKAIDWLFIPTNWVRIFAGVGGAVLTGAGIFQLSHTGSTVSIPVAGEVSYPRAMSLPLGIAMVGTGGMLLFVAFHNLPSDVENFPALVGYVAGEIRSGTKTPAIADTDQGQTVPKAPVAGGIVGHATNAIKDFLDLISGGLAGIVP